MRTTDITICQVPSHISFECPHCEYDQEIKWEDFMDQCHLDNGWSFSGQVIECPECDKEIEIDATDTD